MRQNYFVAFIFGIIFIQKIDFIGHIYIGEIIAIFYFFFNFFNFRFSDFEKKLVFFSFFISLFQAFLDFHHQTNLNKSLKGFFSYLVFMAVIIFLSRYLKENKNFGKASIFFIGAIIGNFVPLLYFDFPSYFWQNIWKFILGVSIIKLTLVISLFYRKDLPKLYFIISFLIITYFSLLYNTRGLVFVMGVALILYLLLNKSQKYNLKFFNTKLTFMLLPLTYLFLIFAVGFVITSIATPKVFLDQFEDLREKNEMQGQGQLGLTVSARSVVIASLYAIKDRPLIGHGSYADDKNLYYTTKQLEFLYDFGYVDHLPSQKLIDNFFGRQISRHSFLFGAMVSAGILGSVFWIFLTHFIVKNYVNYANHFPLFFHWMVIFYINHLFFTPWAAVTRMELSLNLVLFALYIGFIKEQNLDQNSKIRE